MGIWEALCFFLIHQASIGTTWWLNQPNWKFCCSSNLEHSPVRPSRANFGHVQFPGSIISYTEYSTTRTPLPVHPLTTPDKAWRSPFHLRIFRRFRWISFFEYVPTLKALLRSTAFVDINFQVRPPPVDVQFFWPKMWEPKWTPGRGRPVDGSVKIREWRDL